MAHGKSITSAVAAFVRQVSSGWWGGIGCRVSFFMMVALVLVAVLAGAFFYLEGQKKLDSEIRGRAMYVARELAALTADDIITGNRFELYKKLTPPFAANEGIQSGGPLLYAMVYNHNCSLLIGSTASEVFFDSESYFYTLPSERGAIREDAALNCESSYAREPLFVVKKRHIYDLTLPVLAGEDMVGFVRVGISGKRYEDNFVDIMKKSALAFLGILFVGIAFSQAVTLGILRPVKQLSNAVEKLSRRNWDAELPVTGTDEISKLSLAFNQMAQILKQRDASLSRGNRDLFLLHTTGLDLMESLDSETLISKLAARAGDIVRAETMALSMIDASDRMLKYRGVFGNKAAEILGCEMPIESAGIYNWLVSYGTPLLISDASADFRLDGGLMQSLGIKSIMVVPLWSSNTMVGIFSAINKQDSTRFDKRDLRLFTVFSNLASAALQNASLYGDLKSKMEELKNAQEQLVGSTKMAAIGELSANVAHEINNPLTSVLGYTTYLLKTLNIPESQRKILVMMEQETLRVRKIIRNLLDFSRQRPIRVFPEDISIPLKETAALIRGIAEASSVAIHEEYPAETLLVNMDHNEIKQVFINIVNNALQAMPKGGDLQIKLKTDGNGMVVTQFTDTGTGIAPENIDRIFEPFFSTKENGDGTGLGLSISYRIIQNHGGRIEAKSTLGKGTIFRVYLPQHKEISAVADAGYSS